MPAHIVFLVSENFNLGRDMYCGELYHFVAQRASDSPGACHTLLHTTMKRNSKSRLKVSYLQAWACYKQISLIPTYCLNKCVTITSIYGIVFNTQSRLCVLSAEFGWLV